MAAFQWQGLKLQLHYFTFLNSLQHIIEYTGSLKDYFCLTKKKLIYIFN